MGLLVVLFVFFRIGDPIPADERGPRLRAPDASLVFVPPPPVAIDPTDLDLACHAALAPLSNPYDPPPPLAALAALVHDGLTLGRCTIAIDLVVEMHAFNRAAAGSHLDTHAFWMLAAEAATTTDRRVAAYRNAALYAWHEAIFLVRLSLRATTPFPLEPWLAAGDALARAAVDDPRLTSAAIDAYENALRASRQRPLTRAQAAHIARALDALPDDRARNLRTRIDVRRAL